MKFFFTTLLLSCTLMQLFGQTGDPPLHERIYLHTDKPLYLAGELIRMKLVTLNENNIPLVFSKIAYAELVCDSIARVQIKVALNHGVGEGRMMLPADLPSGYYRLIAYTQYMRNEGVDVFFEKNIGVINTFQSGYYPQTSETATTPSSALSSSSPSSSSNNRVDITIQPDKTSYTTRALGELYITGLPENIHTLSVTISGKETKTDEPPLFPQNQHPVPTVFVDKYLPEFEGHIITGTMIDNQTGKAMETAPSFTPLLTFPGKGISIFVGQKSETGDIRFFTTGNYETKQVATVVFQTGEKYRIDIHSPFITRFAPKPTRSLHIDSTCYNQLLERSVALQASHFFSEESDDDSPFFEPTFPLQPTHKYPLDEYTRFTTMREIFIEFIPSARFQNRNGVRELSAIIRKGSNVYYGTNPLVLLDGAPISNHNIIFNYDPLKVEFINIYNNLCILGTYTLDGIIEFQTYKSRIQDVNFDKATQIIPYEGPQSRNTFVSPDYSIAKNRQNRTYDSRHTLLWNPDLQTQGKPFIHIPFNTSDLTGEFQATLEGLTQTGEFFFATTCFKVE